MASDVLTRFILNLTKSELTPSQDLNYIGSHRWTNLRKVFLPLPHMEALMKCLKTFLQLGQYKPAHQFVCLLGLMASCLAVVPFTHRHMRLIQWHMKDRWKPTQDLTACIMVTIGTSGGGSLRPTFRRSPPPALTVTIEMRT
jgi:hypothetical protein